MSHTGPKALDPEGVYTLKLGGLISAGTLDAETGEVHEIEAPMDHEQHVRLTGRQALELERQQAERASRSA